MFANIKELTKLREVVVRVLIAKAKDEVDSESKIKKGEA